MGEFYYLMVETFGKGLAIVLYVFFFSSFLNLIALGIQCFIDTIIKIKENSKTKEKIKN